MKKAHSTTIYLLLFTLLMLGLMACGENATVKKFAEELNSKCPLQLDPLIKLNKVDFDAPKTVVYNYTIDIKGDSDAELLNALKENIKTNTSYDVINKEQFKAIKEAGATLKFVYKTQTGKDFLSYQLEPSFYEKGKLDLTDAELENLLKQSCIVLNSQLPRLINQEISFDKVQYTSPNTLEYTYTFVELDQADFDDVTIENLRNQVSASFINAKDTEKLLKDNNTIFIFSYLDKNGTLITSLELTPEKYK